MTQHRDEFDVVPLRHPWRVVAAIVLLLLAAAFVWSLATNPAWQWDTFLRYLLDVRIARAALVTLELTVLAMLLAVACGGLAALMRRSDNPVLRWMAWAYAWTFRGTPVYVQLVFWGLLGSIYKQVSFGSLLTLRTDDWLTPFAAAVIGLGLNEGAYMSEIVRAGLASVDEGQQEAAQALGMSRGQTLWRIVLPQAMRVIIPPTGNEVIGMLKTTSLVIAVPFTLDLYSRTNEIAAVLYQPIPLLLVASAWYLAMTTALMALQQLLERRFSRGSRRDAVTGDPRSLASRIGGAR